jgi:hypothetical protein
VKTTTDERDHGAWAQCGRTIGCPNLIIFSTLMINGAFFSHNWHVGLLNKFCWQHASAYFQVRGGSATEVLNKIFF